MLLDGRNVSIAKIIALWNRSAPADKQLFLRKLNFKTEKAFMDYLENHLRGNSYTTQSGIEASLSSYAEYRYHEYLMMYVPPFILVIGVLGNLVSFVILRRRLMLKQSTYLYLAILAIFDTGVLMVGLLRYWVASLTGYQIMTHSDWICKMSQFLGHTFSDVSVWLIVVVTIERYVVVCQPLKTSYVCSMKRARVTLVVLISVVVVINTHFFWTVQTVKNATNHTSCTGHGLYKHLIEDHWPWVDACIYSFIPFVTITCFNCIIIYRISEARRSRDTLQSDTSSISAMSSRRDAFKKSETKITVTLLAISIAFLVTALPMNIYLIATAFWKLFRDNNMPNDGDWSLVAKFMLADTITTLLMYTNHGINFFLYCATGKKFRRQLSMIVCAGRFAQIETEPAVKFTAIKSNSSEERRRANGYQAQNAKPLNQPTVETYYVPVS